MTLGLVIATQGPHYLVQTAEHPHGLLCYSRKKKRVACVGDTVTIEITSTENGVIDHVAERKNIFFRSDQQRSKQFAANIDKILLVVATEPEFSLDLIGRALTAAWSQGIEPVIILNKIDQAELLPNARAKLAPYATLGVHIVEVSARDPALVLREILPLLHQQTCLLLGQSGMGKSSLLNILVPDADAATREISQALGSGKHTTTHTQLYAIPEQGGRIIDSPGFQSFGLHHLDRTTLERGFPEFAAYSSECKFYNCSHRHEPKCAVVAAYNAGKILPARYQLYQMLLSEYEAGLHPY